MHLPSAALALALGALGGFIADLAGLPLPWLLGALAATAAAALAGWQPLGRPLAAPGALRLVFVPVIGVAIGAAFTPGLLGDLSRWWPSLAAVLVFVPLAHAAAYWMTRRLGGVDAPTAYYGAMPGGFIEAITLGEEAGADPAMLAVLQFLRLILCIVLIPVGFALFTGHAVGSAAGAVIGEVGTLSARDWAVLAASGVAGALIGRRLRLPAALMTGPILASGAAHLAGWVAGGPPGWLVDLTQLVIGATLGARFAGRSPRILLAGARLAAANFAFAIALAAALAALLAGLVGERPEAVLLAFAPGGLAEMSLVALSLEISVVYVSAHHVLRIVATVFVARAMAPRFLGAPPGGG